LGVSSEFRVLQNTFKLILFMVALMSGILSLVRELYGMYAGNLPPRNLFWSCALIAFIISSFILLWGENKARKKAEKALAAIENARPQIILKEPHAIYIQDVLFTGPNMKTYATRFLKVRFVNAPLATHPTCNADGVKADIQFFRGDEKHPLLEIEGRWSDSDQPSTRKFAESRTDLLRARFGIGDIHELDIAYRDPRTMSCYAWNNDNYNYPDFTKPEHLLDGETFRAEVRLIGTWVDERFNLRFRNTRTGELEII
jgi:hypothetical protein